MEILALYTSPEALPTALAAGARHLAALSDGFALVFGPDTDLSDPEGWAGFTCARDAQNAATSLSRLRSELAGAERPGKANGPREPARIWARAAGGVYGFPLRFGGRTLGVALIGVPGAWPRVRTPEIESVLRQLALVLDHASLLTQGTKPSEPADELLRLSEELLARDVELLKRDEREDAEKQLGNDLVDKMSHELRVPLNSMIERTISVLAGDHEDLSEGGRLGLREVLDEGNALARMLQNIQDLWAIRQDRVRLEIQDVNMLEVAEEAVFNVRDQLRPGVALERKLGAPLPRIRTDLAKLNQVLFHLLDNAVRFTKRGRIEFEVSVEHGELRCVISDTGIGISADDQSQIFDEFFQVDPARNSERRGAGLGLTLARALVDKLGGALTFESEIGRGSAFRVAIPVGVL